MQRTAIWALALALVPAAAFAADRPVGSVGGYMNLGAGVSDGNTSEDPEVGIIRDGEIHLKGRGASDNGLTYEVRVELEAFTTGDQIDENWGKVSGVFGEVLIGGADTALNEYGGVGVVKPTGIFNYYDGTIDTAPGGGVGFIGKDDALGVRYGTPVIAGFQAGASYQPNADTDGANDTGYGLASRGPGRSDVKDQIAVGASFETEVQSVGFGIGAGYLTGEGAGAEDLYHVGLELSYAGVTAAGLYNRTEDAAGDTDGYGAGLQYRTGPWTVGGGVFIQEGDNESIYGTFGGTYALAPGVDAIAVVELGDETGDGRDSGFGVQTFLNIRF